MSQILSAHPDLLSVSALGAPTFNEVAGYSILALGWLFTVALLAVEVVELRRKRSAR